MEDVDSRQIYRPSSRRTVSSLTDQVYDQIRTEIIRGDLQPGTRLVELDLADRMGTSQGPVREALQRLEREGLVFKQKRSATFVTEMPIDEMYALFSVRSAIEGFTISRAVSRLTDEHLQILESLVEQMRIAGQAGDLFALTEYDLEFHRQIGIWADSPSLLRSWNPLYSQIQRFVVQTHADHFQKLTDIADTHLPILAALRVGDQDGASAVMQEHIMLIWSRIGARDSDQAVTRN
jgi:DNA-binding GntR family transcriptional regulator